MVKHREFPHSIGTMQLGCFIYEQVMDVMGLYSRVGLYTIHKNIDGHQPMKGGICKDSPSKRMHDHTTLIPRIEWWFGT
jgi:hypothetical protein